ncbi:MAG TPA: choice-of-anchor tandem repeat GloVer-containing protein [Candidatus Tumulicola sp.]|jgi:uncharacterized repeat protein (TIGR03803 family)
MRGSSRIVKGYGLPALVVMFGLTGCGSNAGPPIEPAMHWAVPASSSKVKDVVADLQPESAVPYGGLLLGSDGQMFGTTSQGGTSASGFGSVIAYDGSGVHTVYAFRGMPDGAAPEAGLVQDSSGVLYGTTTYGGAVCPAGCGTVFDLIPNGSTYTEKVLYAFQGGQDGAYPIGGLLIDKSGALYGTTFQGGGAAACSGGCGIVFKLVRSGKTYKETVAHRFKGGQDGANPVGTLIADSAGTVYGTAKSGGNSSACSGGCGVVYKLKRSGATYVESVVHSFAGGYSDGATPRSALLAGKHGTLYGTTLYAGSGANAGVVFELTPSGKEYSEKVIFKFSGGKTGAQPHDENGLIADTKGNIYGTASAGGTAKSFGVVFKLTPSGSQYSETVLHEFQGPAKDGESPWAGVIIGSDKNLWGVTPYGGSGTCDTSGVAGCGVLFRLTP